MTYKDWDSPSWRDEAGLTFRTSYKRKWALLPVECKNGEKVWLGSYYTVHRLWGSTYTDNRNYSHKDFLGNITESEYIVRKLADNL